MFLIVYYYFFFFEKIYTFKICNIFRYIFIDFNVTKTLRCIFNGNENTTTRCEVKKTFAEVVIIERYAYLLKNSGGVRLNLIVSNVNMCLFRFCYSVILVSMCTLENLCSKIKIQCV